MTEHIARVTVDFEVPQEVGDTETVRFFEENGFDIVELHFYQKKRKNDVKPNTNNSLVNVFSNTELK